VILSLKQTDPRKLSEVLCNWLEAYPEKILFGTGSVMMSDHEIARAHAVEPARLVLRGNAIKLYSLPVK
jgi:hypothetical protein